MPFLHVTLYPSSYLPQCPLFISFSLETGRSHKRGCVSLVLLTIRTLLEAASQGAKLLLGTWGVFYWTGNLIQKIHHCKHSSMRDIWATDAHPIWMIHNKNVLKFLPGRASLHPWKCSLVLFTERRIKDIIILSDWIVYISSAASLSLTYIVKSKINVASATQWLWLTIICILYWKSIVCMLPAVKLCNKQ